MHYKAACGREEEAEKAREALQSEYEHIVEELRSHEEAMASLEKKVEEEGGKREEELSRCQKAIEELKQQLEDSEQSRVEQQQKVMVVNSRYSGGNGRQFQRLILMRYAASFRHVSNGNGRHVYLAACALVDLPVQARFP